MDDHTLSDDERQFFETGQLPASLLPPPPEPVPATPSPESSISPPPQAQPTSPAQPSPQTVTPPNSDYLQQSLHAATQRYQSLEQQINQLTAQLQHLTTTPDPDPSVDPLGAITAKLNHLHTELATIKQSTLQTIHQQAFNAFLDNVKALRTEFTSKTPDFQDAYAYIRSVRTDDFRSLGIPEPDIPQYLTQEEIQLAQTAIQSGRNPAQLLYDLAKRHGYTPKSAPSISPTPLPAIDKLAQLKAGTSTTHEPSRATPTETLTLETLKDASSSDLDNLVTNDDAWHKLVGGRPLGKSIF